MNINNTNRSDRLRLLSFDNTSCKLNIVVVLYRAAVRPTDVSHTRCQRSLPASDQRSITTVEPHMTSHNTKCTRAGQGNARRAFVHATVPPSELYYF